MNNNGIKKLSCFQNNVGHGQNKMQRHYFNSVSLSLTLYSQQDSRLSMLSTLCSDKHNGMGIRYTLNTRQLTQ